MRGERELSSLNIVKDAMFCKDGKPMQNPFTHKTYLDVSDHEFKKDRIWFVNSECHKSYFGFVENDREEFESVLRVAQANPAVIFLNQASVEVIRTENISYLIKLLLRDYVVYPLQVTSAASVYDISVPVDQCSCAVK